MNQRMKSALEHYPQWQRSTITDLKQAYKKPSPAKKAAWGYCQKLCRDLQGRDLRIVVYNVYFFTAGFAFDDKFMYITKSSNTPVLRETQEGPARPIC